VPADLIGGLRKAAGVFFGSLWRMARQLFHETTGALFAVFALVGAGTAWREWRRGGASWRVGISLAFVVMMAFFAVAAFRSARRVR
jgi:hypothetical protein